MSIPDERSGRRHLPLSMLDELLDDAAVAVDCLSAIVRVCSEATGKAVTLFDRQGHVVASSRPEAGQADHVPTTSRDRGRAHDTPTSADPVLIARRTGHRVVAAQDPQRDRRTRRTPRMARRRRTTHAVLSHGRVRDPPLRPPHRRAVPHSASHHPGRLECAVRTWPANSFAAPAPGPISRRVPNTSA